MSYCELQCHAFGAVLSDVRRSTIFPVSNNHMVSNAHLTTMRSRALLQPPVPSRRRCPGHGGGGTGQTLVVRMREASSKSKINRRIRFLEITETNLRNSFIYSK